MNAVRGSGTYATVVSPPIASPQFGTSFVGKIVFVTNDAAESEWRVARKLRQVDPESVHLVYPQYMTCVHRSHVSGIVPQGTSAEVYIQFIMPDAGVTLSSFLHRTNGISLRLLLKFSLDIANGIRILVREDVSHRDLHPRNIMIHDNRCRIIDWGLALTDTSKTFYDDATLEWCAYYAVHPPDIRLVYGFHDNFQSEVKTIKDYLRLTGNAGDFVFRNKKYRLSYTTTASAIRRLSKSSSSADVLKQLQSHLTADVYALGLCMMRMYIMCDAETGPVTKRLRALIVNMMYADPRERMRIDDVAAELQCLHAGEM